jgi:glutaminase
MLETGVLDVTQHAFTGELPQEQRITALMTAVHDRYAGLDEGTLADYIPALAEADPAWFGLALVGVRGRSFTVGDAEIAFSIQSVSKPFVFALVSEVLGHVAVHDRVGVNNTGLPFDSVMAIELNDGHPMNGMVNAGAIATTALLPGTSAAERWDHVRDGLSRFAGRELRLDDAVYRSEAETNQRNKALARLLESYGRLDVDPIEIVDVYTRQCALSVTVTDLAVMGATLANGGVNPISGQQVVSSQVAQDTLAVLASCGLYERSGEWLFEIGLPAKSGVSGGIVAMAPGKGAVGSFSPRLDSAGNSVRGQRACAYLSRAAGMNLFASAPAGPLSS